MSQRELICREKAALRGKQRNPKAQSGPQTVYRLSEDYSEYRLQWK